MKTQSCSDGAVSPFPALLRQKVVPIFRTFILVRAASWGTSAERSRYSSREMA